VLLPPPSSVASCCRHQSVTVPAQSAQPVFLSPLQPSRRFQLSLHREDEKKEMKKEGCSQRRNKRRNAEKKKKEEEKKKK
jgi:hypothetical protein